MGTETLIAVLVSNVVLGIWEYFLGKTKTINANSTAELAGSLVGKLISRGK